MFDWERYLEALSPPSKIELGLERVGEVWSRLQCTGSSRVVTIAGTNGKGSTVEVAGLIADHAGLSYGQYTSPHIHRIHERIRINGQMVSDEKLIRAFETVEAAQSDVFLTYFEFVTLACFVLFDSARLDLWILEIGLGGRLDAVNLIDPDVSIITSIGFDHQTYLGNSLEEIAAEKAGVMRECTPTFSAASNVKRTLLTEAQRHDAVLFWVDQAFDGNTLTLPSSGLVLDVSSARLPRISVALACLAMDVLGHLTSRSIEKTLNQASLTGRMSKHVIGGRSYILDVGHNALACKFVTQSLEAVIPRRQRIVIFGALQDKDVNRMLPVLKGFTDRVVLVGIEGERGRSIYSLEESWSSLFEQTCWRSFATLPVAMRELSSELNLDDQVLVIGSFVLVADALRDDLFN
ncbi:MAG: Mur ligase family protein [Pseudomonadota bacterium]|nr:Mur ligase family protein [Pseudomonadota bacterium]